MPAAQDIPSQTYAQNPEAQPAALRDGALRSASVDEIRAAIDQFGAGPVVWTLWGRETDEGWLRVIDHISTGDPDWLSLVPLLEPSTDAGASETLHIAVSEALQHNPDGVLRLVSGPDQINLVCRCGQLEPSEAEIAAFYTATSRAVAAVDAPDIQTVKDQCLAALAENRALDMRSVRERMQ